MLRFVANSYTTKDLVIVNDIRFCFEFCLLIVALATTRRGGIKNGGGSG